MRWNRPCLPQPLLYTAQSAATTPGTCHSRRFEMKLGRDQRMRPLPVLQQRPKLRSVSLDSSPALHFVAVRGSRAGGAASSVLLLPPLLSSSFSRGFCLVAPFLAPSRAFISPSQWGYFPSFSFLRGWDVFFPSAQAPTRLRGHSRARETATHRVPQLRAAGAGPRPRR